MTRLTYLAVIVYELMRWLTHEIRHKHFNTFGLHFAQFLANEVAIGAYSGTRLRVVLVFIMSACTNGDHPECLHVICSSVSADGLPIEDLSPDASRRLLAAPAVASYPRVAERLKHQAGLC